MTVVICLVQYFSMGIPVWLSFIAILLSLPLMLVGLRVLGETNWGPISAMSNMMQAIFAFISPGNRAGQHVFERTDRNHRGDLGSADAGLQGRTTDPLESAQPDDRAADRRAGWLAGDGADLPSIAR